MSKWHGGKGSKLRPVDNKKFDDNWERIFGKCKLCGAKHNGTGFYHEDHGRLCDGCGLEARERDLRIESDRDYSERF